MALNPRLKNELKRAQLSVNPKYVTIEALPDPAMEGMGLILRCCVRGIHSRGTADLEKAPVSVTSYTFHVYVPENTYDADAPSPITVRFEGVMPYSLHAFPSGHFCYGPKRPTPPLHVIIRKVLLACVFAPELMDESDRANSNTVAWTRAHKAEFPYFPPELLFVRTIPSNPFAASMAAPRPVIRRC